MSQRQLSLYNQHLKKNYTHVHVSICFNRIITSILSFYNHQTPRFSAIMDILAPLLTLSTSSPRSPASATPLSRPPAWAASGPVYVSYHVAGSFPRGVCSTLVVMTERCRRGEVPRALSRSSARGVARRLRREPPRGAMFTLGSLILCLFNLLSPALRSTLTQSRTRSYNTDAFH